MQDKQVYTAIGVMSGSSLDGLDIVAVRFTEEDQQWSYDLLASELYQYDLGWEEALRSAHQLELRDYVSFDASFGRHIGDRIWKFIAQHQLYNVDVIGSHGHTILHDPGNGFTLQAGSGAHIAAVTGIDVVADLRAGDVALGGQGAPIIPIGEKWLFAEHSCFLNIGGICNISFHLDDKVVAYDIGPGNTPANYLAGQVGLPYDKDGALGAKGKVIPEVLERLDKFSFYQRPIPRSLHTHLIVHRFMKSLLHQPHSVEDLLCTYYHHIAEKITAQIDGYKDSISQPSIMITGGGAHNRYLIDLIKAKTSFDVYIPDPMIIDYKEAIVMAFFAVLRMLNRNNCLASVTGASKDNCSGVLHKA